MKTRRTPSLPAPRRAGAFTLIEVVLAATLSAIVLLAALGFFSLINQSEERQTERQRQAIEFNRAYRTIERALQLLVMSEAPVNDEDLSSRFAEFRSRVDEDRPDEREEEDERPRFWLYSDPQVLEVALRGPPILGGGSPLLDEYLAAAEAGPERSTRHRASESRRRLRGGDSEAASSSRSGSADSGRGRSGRSSDRSSSRRGSSDRSERESDERSAAERGQDQIDQDLERWIEDDLLLAPGVWGQFVLLPDSEQPAPPEETGGADVRSAAARRRAAAAEQQGHTLWWNEYPPPDLMALDSELDAKASGSPAAPARSAVPGQPYAGKWIKLVSGLSACRWSVYRQRQFDSRCYAVNSEELPAFVKLDLKTIAGREEHWMFEVGWTKGPAPGEPVGTAPSGRSDAERSRSEGDRRSERDLNVRNLDGSPVRPMGNDRSGGSRGGSR